MEEFNWRFNMGLYIQDPSYTDSAYLHEALISSCINSVSGGGAYAFASKDGIELLIEDENFKKFLKNGTFTLVIGMDDITNIYSIDTLKRLQEKYSGHLIVKAYIHNGKGSIFHPKYSWFSYENGGTLVIGSGNLTQKGLRQNREAYSIEKYEGEKFNEVISEWNNWINHSKMFLFDINDDIVHEYAIKNTRKMGEIIKVQKQYGDKSGMDRILKYAELFSLQPKDKKYYVSNGNHQKEIVELGLNPQAESGFYGEDVDIDMSYWTIYLNSEVLIAEIPKSGSRWQQVNFDKNSFEEFFGATCGENGVYRILFRSITEDGTLKNVEVRPSVSVSSLNYRFELDAAKGLDYPMGKERPLGVFVKVSPRDFIYQLVMPGDFAYQSCIEVLDSKAAYSSRMRRIRYLCKEIYENTPQLSLWKRLDVEEDE